MRINIYSDRNHLVQELDSGNIYIYSTYLKKTATVFSLR